MENNVVEAYKPYYVVVNKGEVSLSTYTEHVIATQSDILSRLLMDLSK